MTKKHRNIVGFQQKCTNFRDLVKKGPKNLGIGKPPPLPFGQCPKVSDFFQRMPSLRDGGNVDDKGSPLKEPACPDFLPLEHDNIRKVFMFER